MLELNSFHTGTSILTRIEAMHMIKKTFDLQAQSVQKRKQFVHELFELTTMKIPTGILIVVWNVSLICTKYQKTLSKVIFFLFVPYIHCYNSNSFITGTP